MCRYPGDATLAWLWTHGFRVVGFYLNHHRGSEDETWISRRSVLVNAGWGLGPLYLGWQTVDNQGNHLPAPGDPLGAASSDAAEAINLMTKAGFSPGSVIFFDIEDGTTPSGSYDSYFDAWFSAVRAANFLPAVYCSHLLIPWATAKNIPCWSVHVPLNSDSPLDPGSLPASLDAGAIGTQFRQEIYLTGLPTRIDLNCFSVPDPSSAAAAVQAVL